MLNTRNHRHRDNHKHTLTTASRRLSIDYLNIESLSFTQYDMRSAVHLVPKASIFHVVDQGLAEYEEKQNLEWEKLEEKTGKCRKHFEEDSNNQKENVKRNR